MHSYLKYHSIPVTLIIIGGLFASTINELFSDNYNPDEPLYLTKYIECGDIELVC